MEEDEPPGGGGSSDDGDPCKPCTNDPGGPQGFCENQPGGNDGVPQGCAVEEDVEITDPCGQVDSLASDPTFIAKMDSLVMNANTKNRETGYIMRRNENGSFSFEYQQGNLGEHHMNFTGTGPIDGTAHSHFTDGSSIFTATDIRQIYQLKNQGAILNLSAFTTVMVGPQGTAYMLKIMNVTKFNNFANAHLMGSNFDTFKFTYVQAYQIWENNPVGLNEQNFLNMLETEDTGLRLFKGDPDEFNDWQLKGLNSNNEVIDEDCE